ncbi:DUF4240 domain-containing protein [Nodosilinea sp. LEGE 06152]|uniref:DUF4240 domain-containing protein n=1 Tax=Nodosilinea sp. LEGE 06152 TaxID=2777966 RepID=UPI00188054C0|nr:DUF4240 domain-containing protein [Nodosilinea sp. LEGE 06152]MBE9160315.1 DUF4240 domain-containing protein [Nodosilinea sp. LEGE 06152]
MAIGIGKFWAAINTIYKAALDRKEEEKNAALLPLARVLISFSLSELEEFEQHLHEVLFAIDGEDFFDTSGQTSGDGFLYCRCYVVAKGLEFYNHVLQNPSLMPDQEYEPLLYVASNAWAVKTGNKADDWPFVSSISYETGCNSARWSELNPVELTLEQVAEQHELNYQRALSSVVHAYRKGYFEQVVKLLKQYRSRLSEQFSDMLQDAQSQLRT